MRTKLIILWYRLKIALGFEVVKKAQMSDFIDQNSFNAVAEELKQRILGPK